MSLDNYDSVTEGFLVPLKSVRYYRICGRTVMGNKYEFTVPAATESEARRLCGVDLHTITNIKEDVGLGAFNVRRQYLKPMPLMRQSLVLSSLANALSLKDSGILESTRQILKSSPATIKYLYVIRKCETVTDILNALCIDPESASLARNADFDGAYYEALIDAADMARSKAKAQKEIVSALTKLYGYCGMSIIAILFMSIFAHTYMVDNLESNFPRDYNVLSWALYYLGGSLVKGWPLIIALVVAAAFFKDRIPNFWRNWKIIRHYYALLMLFRANVFSTTFIRRIYQDSPDAILVFMVKNSRGRDRKIYEHMLGSIRQGSQISDILDASEWPIDMVLTFNGIEKRKRTEVDQMHIRLRETLETLSENESSRFTLGLTVLGLLIPMSCVVAMVVGIYLPSLTL